MASCMWLTFDGMQKAVGEQAANKLCEALGGASLYLPRKADAAHPVARAAGTDVLRVLCDSFGPGSVAFPKSNRSPRKPDIIARLLDGGTVRDIASAVGVSRRYVFRLKRDMRKH